MPANHDPRRMLTFAINNTAFRELVDEFPEERFDHTQPIGDVIAQEVQDSQKNPTDPNLPQLEAQWKIG